MTNNYNEETIRRSQEELLEQVKKASPSKEQVLIEDGTMSSFGLNNGCEIPVQR